MKLAAACLLAAFCAALSRTVISKEEAEKLEPLFADFRQAQRAYQLAATASIDVLDNSKAVKAAEKRRNEAGQKAISAVLKTYGLVADLGDGIIKRGPKRGRKVLSVQPLLSERTPSSDFQVSAVRWPDGSITVHPNGLSRSPGFLAAVLLHELVHVEQLVRVTPHSTTELGQELAAHGVAIVYARSLGLSKREIEVLESIQTGHIRYIRNRNWANPMPHVAPKPGFAELYAMAQRLCRPPPALQEELDALPLSGEPAAYAAERDRLLISGFGGGCEKDAYLSLLDELSSGKAPRALPTVQTPPPEPQVLIPEPFDPPGIAVSRAPPDAAWQLSALAAKVCDGSAAAADLALDWFPTGAYIASSDGLGDSLEGCRREAFAKMLALNLERKALTLEALRPPPSAAPSSGDGRSPDCVMRGIWSKSCY